MTYRIGRREFLQSVAVIAAATRAGAQTPAASEWGTQVLDIHLHPRATVEGRRPSRRIPIDSCDSRAST